MALTITTRDELSKEFFICPKKTIEKLTELNEQSVRYQNLIASLSSVNDISEIYTFTK